MKRTKLIVNLASAAILVIAAAIGYRMWQAQTAAGETDGFDPPQPAAAEETSAPPAQSPPPDSHKAVRQKTLREIAAKVEKTIAGRPSPERSQALRAISADAVARLGPTSELIGYMQFLAAAGVMDERERLLAGGSAGLFDGPQAKAALEWLPTISDPAIRARLSRSAGEVFDAEGFAAFFESFYGMADHSTAAAFLYGHCGALARKDPAEAIRVYKELGYPKKIDNTGMASVMAAAPPDSNFASLAKGIGNDKFSLAKPARAALLRNWAGNHPQQAAEYVAAANPEAVHPDQMAIVMNQWIGKDPEAAATWLSQAPKGLPADEGLAALARHFAEGAPAKAWTFVTAISDPEIRRLAAERVAMAWRRTDPQAAAAAMEKAGTR
ncbi:MAG: hypothetical protein J0M04_18360 [Verrucomicrobia bacterium]|nr:hypothetical protein [Verrucomicrobiota bacterium]